MLRATRQLRDQEAAIVEHAERAYEVMVSQWQPQQPPHD